MKKNSFSQLVKPAFSKLIFITIIISITCNACGLFESDLNEETHKTQIVVQLAGELTKYEVATVSVDNEVIGTATNVDVATKEVTAGMHKVSAVDSKGEVAWNPIIVDVKEQQTFRVTLSCDPVVFTIRIADKCDEADGPDFPLNVMVRDEKGTTTLLTGHTIRDNQVTAIATSDHGFLKILIEDVNHKLWLEYPQQYFQYKSSGTVDLTCQ